jgi:hypothetical protein
MTKQSNDFHDHLDVCVHCANHPFNLCLKGQQLLIEAVKDAPVIVIDSVTAYNAHMIEQLNRK